MIKIRIFHTMGAPKHVEGRINAFLETIPWESVKLVKHSTSAGRLTISLFYDDSMVCKKNDSIFTLGEPTDGDAD